MPLSDNEQRLLEQIERGLYADDPKFASAVRSTSLRTVLSRRLRRSIVLLTIGFVVLLTGLVLQFVWLSVAAFPLMLFAALRGLQSFARLSGRNDPIRPTRSRGRSRQPRKSWVERVEERWRRRWEERS